MAFTFASCNESKLQVAVDAANKDCPLDLGEDMTVMAVYIENKFVVYDMDIDEDELPISLIRNSKGAIKDAMLESFVFSDAMDNKELLEICRDTNTGIIYRMRNPGSDETCDIKIYADELVSNGSSSDDDEDDEDDEYEVITRNVELANAQGPVEIDKGLIMSSIEVKDNFIVYTCEVDEDVFSIDEFRSKRATMKATILENMKSNENPDAQNLISMCRKNRVGRKYVYRGSKSGDSIVITIPYTDL